MSTFTFSFFLQKKLLPPALVVPPTATAAHRSDSTLAATPASAAAVATWSPPANFSQGFIPSPSLLFSSFRHHLPTMASISLFFAATAAVVVALFGLSTAGSDAPRGVAVGFVFDPQAKCDPPCEHAGVCIRNNTCFCSRGYEGETCQYGDVTHTHSLHFFFFYN